jgi:NADPH:quinone reductase-like Zn-dependent oxidoreductase
LNIRGSTLRARSLDYKVKLTKVQVLRYVHPHRPNLSSGGNVVADEFLDMGQEFEAFAMDKFQEGWLKALITKTFSWEHVADAHRYMESNQSVGKIVLNGM